MPARGAPAAVAKGILAADCRPAARPVRRAIALDVVRPAQRVQRQVVDGPAAQADGVVGHQLEADRHGLAGVRREVDAIGLPAVGGAGHVRSDRIPLARSKGAVRGEHGPRLAVGRGQDVALVPALLDLVPGAPREADRHALLDLGEVERAPQARVHGIAAAGPPGVVARAVGGVEQGSVRGALEGQLDAAAAGQVGDVPVVHAVLRHGLVRALGRQRHGLDGLHSVAVVPVRVARRAARADAVGRRPVQERRVERGRRADRGQRGLDAGGAVLRRVRDGREDGVAEAVVEPGEEEVGGGVVRVVAAHRVPIRQRRVWRPPVGLPELRRIAHQVRRHLAQALVDPRGLAVVAVPVDHVLELVGYEAQVVGGAGRVHAEVDVEHLHGVGVRVDGLGHLVRAAEVAGDAGHRLVVQHVHARVVVHAGRPLAPKDLAQPRVDGTGERLRAVLQLGAVERLVHLHPEPGVVGDDLEPRLDVQLAVVDDVVHAKRLDVAHAAGDGRLGPRARRLGFRDAA